MTPTTAKEISNHLWSESTISCCRRCLRGSRLYVGINLHIRDYCLCLLLAAMPYCYVVADHLYKTLLLLFVWTLEHDWVSEWTASEEEAYRSVVGRLKLEACQCRDRDRRDAPLRLIVRSSCTWDMIQTNGLWMRVAFRNITGLAAKDHVWVIIIAWGQFSIVCNWDEEMGFYQSPS